MARRRTQWRKRAATRVKKRKSERERNAAEATRGALPHDVDEHTPNTHRELGTLTRGGATPAMGGREGEPELVKRRAAQRRREAMGSERERERKEKQQQKQREGRRRGITDQPVPLFPFSQHWVGSPCPTIPWACASPGKERGRRRRNRWLCMYVYVNMLTRPLQSTVSGGGARDKCVLLGCATPELRRTNHRIGGTFQLAAQRPNRAIGRAVRCTWTHYTCAARTSTLTPLWRSPQRGTASDHPR